MSERYHRVAKFVSETGPPSKRSPSSTGPKTQEENTTMSDQRPNDQRPSPRPPLRRARLIHGHAVTMTDTGMIVDDLEIIYSPSRAEASREIGARQRALIFAGVEAHEALAMALAECPPVYRIAYLR